MCLIYRTISLYHCELFVNFIGLMLRGKMFFGGMKKNEKKPYSLHRIISHGAQSLGKKGAAYSQEFTVLNVMCSHFSEVVVNCF